MTGLDEAPARGLLGMGVPSAERPVCGTYRETTVPRVQRGASLLGSSRRRDLVWGVERLWGGVVVRVGLGGKDSTRVPSALGSGENRVLCLEVRSNPDGSDSPLHSAGTSGGSRVDSALSPPYLCFRHRGEEKRPGCGRAIS